MADNGYSDGSIVVDTDLDTKGFEAGSDRMKHATDSAIDSFHEMGDAIRDAANEGVSAVSDAAPILEEKAREYVDTFRTSSEDIQNFIDGWADAVPEKKFNSSLNGISKMIDGLESKFVDLSRAYNDAAEGGDKSISKFENKAASVEAGISRVNSKIEDLYATTIKTKNGELLSGKNNDDLKLLIDKFNGLRKELNAMQTEIIKVKAEAERAKAAEVAAIEKVKAETDAAKDSTRKLADQNKQAWQTVKQEIKSAESDTKAFDSSYNSIEKSVKSLENKMFSIGPAAKRAMSGSESAVDSFEFKVSNAQRTIQELRERLEALGSTTVTTVEYDEINAKLEQARATLDGYIREQQRALNSGISLDSPEWEKLTAKVNAAKDAVYRFEAQKMQLEYEGSTISGADTGAYQELVQRLAQAESELENYETKVVRANRATGTLGTVLKGIGKVGVSSFKLLGKGIAAATSKMRSFTKSSNGGMAAVKKLTKAFTSLGSRIKSLIKRRFISALISGATEGIKNLAQVSPEVSAAMSSITTSLSRLKNSFGAAFAPIITTVAPILTYLINLLSEAFTKIGMFIAALTGATSFKKATSDQEAYAKSLNDTSKAADKANKSVAGFDELNNTTSSDSSSTDSGVDMSNMFEDVPIDSKIANFAKKLKDAFLSGDFEGIGEMLASKINGIFSKINKAVDWNNVGPAITAVVNGLTRTFNSLVDNIDWALIGDTFAKGVNTIINTVYLLATGIDWANLGKKLMEGLNAFVYGVDWKKLGVTIGTLFQSALSFINAVVINFDYKALATGFGNAINGAFSAINWAMLGSTISTAIRNAFQFIKTLADTIDFKQIGADVATALNNIDWPGIFGDLAGMLSSLLGGALDLLIGFAETLDWYKLGNDIWDSLVSIVTNIDWNKLVSKAFELLGAVFWGAGALFLGLFDKIYEALQGAWDSVSDYFLEKVAEAGGNVGEGILLGIIEVFLGIGTWVREHIFQPFIDAFCKVFGIASPSTVMAEMGGYIIQGLKNGITAAWTGIKTFFTNCWNSIKSGCINAWNSIKTSAVNSWNKVTSTISDASSKIKKTVSEKFTAAKDAVSSKLTNIKSDVSSGFTKAFDTVSSKVSNIKNTVSDKFSGAKDAVTEKLSGIKSKVSEGFTSAFNTVSSKAGSIKDTITNKFTDAKKAVSDKVSDIKTKISDGFGGANTTITDKLSTMKSKISTDFQNMYSTVSGKMSNIGSSISTTFGNSVNSAWTWGSDICINISNGIYAAAQNVSNAVNYIADLIREFLGFSEPEKGPLSKFHTFMPDMLDLMAEGIYKNKSVAINAVSDLAGAIADEAQDTNVLIPINAENQYTHILDTFSDTITDSFIDLISRLEAIAGNVTFATPAVAEGTVIPYKLRQNDDDLADSRKPFDPSEIITSIREVSDKLDDVVTAIDEKETGITDEAVFNSVKKSARKETKATGRNPFAG